MPEGWIGEDEWERKKQNKKKYVKLKAYKI